MYQRDYRDIIGGGLLLLTGALIAWQASTALDLGTVRRMGPGLFPMAVGVLLAGFGLAIMIPAFFRQGTLDAVEIRPTLAVLASVGAFALTIRPYGLLPAIAALVFVAMLAETRFRPVALVGSIVFLSLLAYLIFRVGLGLPLAMVRWPH
ncbi:tripartite tricarboxylate transporter TctB family protein [Aureimonas populi]|nr:tripartite tricarboxylate transporter TctB family protein [Aureimonas populi]